MKIHMDYLEAKVEKFESHFRRGVGPKQGQRSEWLPKKPGLEAKQATEDLVK